MLYGDFFEAECLDSAIQATESEIEKLEELEAKLKTEGMTYLERKISEAKERLTELETRLEEEGRKLDEMYRS